MSRWTFTAAGVVLLAGAAVAQVATPPPPPPDPTPEFKAPEPKRPTAADPAARPGGEGATRPNIEWEPIAVADETGRLPELDEPAELIALKRNPTVGEVTVARIQEVMRDRRVRIARLIVDNLDLVQKIDSGIIDEISLENRDKLAEVTQIVQTLTPSGTLAEELRGRRVMTRIQTEFHEDILQEYWDMVLKQATSDYPDNILEAGMVLSRAIFNEQVREVMDIYDELLAFTSAHAEELVETAGLSEEDGRAFVKAVSAIEDEWEDAKKFDVVKQAFAQLEFRDQQALLKAAVELRPPEPEIEIPETKPAGGRIDIPSGG